MAAAGEICIIAIFAIFAFGLTRSNFALRLHAQRPASLWSALLLGPEGHLSLAWSIALPNLPRQVLPVSRLVRLMLVISFATWTRRSLELSVIDWLYLTVAGKPITFKVKLARACSWWAMHLGQRPLPEGILSKSKTRIPPAIPCSWIACITSNPIGVITQRHQLPGS